MKLIAILPLLLTVHLCSAFSMRGTGNYTLQQQQEKWAGVYSRVTNSHTAAHFQFRYQVGLKIPIPHTNQQRTCGGSLISLEWVLTAAHCVKDGQSVYVYIGSIELGQRPANFHIGMHDVIEHDDFNRYTFMHDIAVIRIRRVELPNVIVQPIRLPPNIGHLTSYDGAQTVFSGWGRTSDLSDRLPVLLQYARFRVISNEQCADFIGTDYIYDGKLCTGTAERISACHGDSGGPLVHYVNNEAIQIGIFSRLGNERCEAGYPNAFTRVDFYLEWIHRNTGIII